MDTTTPPPSPARRPAEAAALLGVPVATLRRWREAGIGPAYYAFDTSGGTTRPIIRYRASDLEAAAAVVTAFRARTERQLGATIADAAHRRGKAPTN